MSYPTLEQYNEALQNPHLSLIDPALRAGNVATTGLGLPLALCGGFALTYTITSNGNKYAVRCFHKQSNALEERYKAISTKIKSLNSNYFLDFEYQSKGIKIKGQDFPVVKMAWASGETLGEFLEKKYRNKKEIEQLKSSIQKLALYLESQQVAHGDIQAGNVMVAQGGQIVQLIDYDGMFVESLKHKDSPELGHRNFQHPQRNAKIWNSSLDRFSFISLHFALRVLEEYPNMWTETQSDGDTILFKANDFANPDNSKIFNKLLSLPQFAVDTKYFIAICKGAFNQIPSFEDFIKQRNIPLLSNQIRAGITGYISPYQVLDASKYALCLNHVGDKVELIGKVIQVKKDYARNGKPYIFINFGNWRGQCVKLCIWSEGLGTFQQHPDQNWNGKWISAIGLMEPPYSGKGYIHLSINITQANQIHIITETEAKFRLLPNTEAIKIIEPPIIVAKPSSTASPTVSSNKDIIEKMEREHLERERVARVERERLERERVARVERERLERERVARVEREKIKESKPSTKNSGCLYVFLIGIFTILLLSMFQEKQATTQPIYSVQPQETAQPITKVEITTVSTSIQSQEQIAESYAKSGSDYYTREDFKKAIEMYQKALEINKALGNKDAMEKNYSALGKVYEKLGDLDKAIEMLQASIDINKN